MRKHTWGIVLSQREIPDIIRNAFPDVSQPRMWVHGTYLLEPVTYGAITDAQATLMNRESLSAYSICSLSYSGEEVQDHSCPEKTAESLAEAEDLPDQQPDQQITPYRDYLERPIRVGDVVAGVKNEQMMVAIVRGWTDKSLLIDELLRDGHYDREQERYIFTGVRLWRTSLRLPPSCFVTGQTEEQIRQQFACRKVVSRY